MDGNVVRIQPVGTSPFSVQQAGNRESRKDAPPFDLKKEMKGEGEKRTSQPQGSEAAPQTEDLPVAPAKDDDAGSKLDVTA